MFTSGGLSPASCSVELPEIVGVIPETSHVFQPLLLVFLLFPPSASPTSRIAVVDGYGALDAPIPGPLDPTAGFDTEPLPTYLALVLVLVGRDTVTTRGDDRRFARTAAVSPPGNGLSDLCLVAVDDADRGNAVRAAGSRR